jgi:hypothetical protein
MSPVYGVMDLTSFFNTLSLFPWNSILRAGQELFREFEKRLGIGRPMRFQHPGVLATILV